jgi:hypothetical protein
MLAHPNFIRTTCCGASEAALSDPGAMFHLSIRIRVMFGDAI